jgi:hypothetical protein
MKETKIVEAEFPAFAPNNKPTSNFKGPSFLSKITETPKVEDTIVRTKEITIPTTRSRYSRYDRQYDEYYNDNDEIEELDPDIEAPKTTEKTEDDGWQTVERKIRVKRDKVQDALDNDDAPLEDDQEDSAWDEQPEEYETYWDERRH